MSDIPLFTSLPPRIIRRNKHGEDIGEHYAAACFQSWQDSGFRPVTLNATSEDLSAQNLPEIIECRTLSRDAGAVLPLRHDERWDAANWDALGQRFLNILSSHLGTRPLAADRRAAYFTEFQEALRLLILGALRNLKHKRRVRNRRMKLQRLSRVNEKHLAEWGTPHPRRCANDGAE